MAGGDLRFGTTSMYMGVMYHKPAPSQRTKLNLHGCSVQIQLASTHCRTTDFMHFGGKIQGELQTSVRVLGKSQVRLSLLGCHQLLVRTSWEDPPASRLRWQCVGT